MGENEKENIKNKLNVDKNILDLFWNLCEKNANIRLNACSEILQVIVKKQREVKNVNESSKDLQYCIERLVKGLASPRDAARLGYTLLLTEILRQFTFVQIEEVLELMKKHLSIVGKQDKRDLVFGQLFAYTSIVRSGRLPNHLYLPEVILSMFNLSQGKNYILNATYEVVADILSQITEDNFKNIWPQLKKTLPSDWETSSAESLWLLLLCIRLFPGTISAKYMKNHWGSNDIFSPDNFNHLKRVMKQTTSSLPNLHPFCTEFLMLAKQRPEFNNIWNSVIDDNLFDEQNEKSFVGFQMIKATLQNSPTKKILKTVMSSKFQMMFCKSFQNSKHAMNPAACHLAEFLSNFVKDCSVPDMQIIILKIFLQPPGNVLSDQILKKKEVSLIIQNLLPDAVKALYDILTAVLLKKKANVDDKELNNMTRFQAANQIANLVAHPVMLPDVDWRMDVIRFLFLHSFFTVKETTSEIPHCDKVYEPLSDALRDSCITAFFRSVNSLHTRTEKQHSSLSGFLEQLLVLIDYAEMLMNATESIEPKFSIEKIQDSWNHLKSIVRKLNKQSKKDGLVNESNAFQALFLQLGFHLFQDPDNIPEVLEELHICCKKSLKSRKHETPCNNEDGESEPPWIGVVVDILLSLLSKSSKHLRSLVAYVFPLFCPFIDKNALQQIFDVINPENADENMVVDESDDENEQDIDFGSGSSSDESDEEADNQPVDEEFKKKIQKALGPAADDSDAESIVLSDTEMFKLDSALSDAFKSRVKSGHTQIRSEEKTLLHFRVRCFDLIMAYLKSEPPMHLVLMCIEPVLAAFEFGHRSKHQGPLLHKAVTALQFITKMKKFQHQNDASKSELKRLLDVLIPKCHKEINMSTSQKLSSLCVFIVLCYRKLENVDSPNKKKSSKTPFYIKTYLSALEKFVSSGSSHMLPNFFTHLMEACPDLAWNFIEPCKSYAFNNSTRLFKRTQCLGLLSESLKYSKSQKDIADDQWLELANSIFPPVIKNLKDGFENSEIKPVYSTELLNIIFTLHSIIKEKTCQSVLEKYTDLLPLLTSTSKGKMQKFSKKGKSLRNKIIVCLGGNINALNKSQVVNEESNEADEKTQRKRKSVELSEDIAEQTEDTAEPVNGDLSSSSKKKKSKNKKNKKITSDMNSTNEIHSDENN